MNELSVEEAAAMEAALTEHYGEPVRPVSAYCKAFQQWATAIRQEDAGDGEGDRTYGRIVEVGMQLELAIRKSNLLWRLIYLGEELRTVKCPAHDGHWSGYAYPGAECPHGCCSGYDITGWLPEVAAQ